MCLCKVNKNRFSYESYCSVYDGIRECGLPNPLKRGFRLDRRYFYAIVNSINNSGIRVYIVFISVLTHRIIFDLSKSVIHSGIKG